MLQERRHKEPGFKRFKVKRFFDVSVTPDFWKAEKLCDKLCEEYYDYEYEFREGGFLVIVIGGATNP